MRRWTVLALTLVAVVIIGIGTLAVSLHYNYIQLQPGLVSNGNVSENTNANKIGVVVTILPEADFVRHVGGDRVEVMVMVPPGASPHIYEPRPEQLKQISTAKIYFKVGSGLGLEQNWLEKISAINPAIKIVDTSKGITIIDNDPHIWNSPANAKIMVINIRDALTQADPENADFYINNARDYLRELDALDAYIHSKLDRFNNRAFMIYHPSFGYLAAQYNLTQIPVEHGGKEPTSRVIRDCIDNARRYNLHYVFVAPQFATTECETIAKEIGGETAPMDPLPANYTANMYKIADLLAEEFAG